MAVNKKHNKHLLVSSDGLAPSNWSETFPSGQVRTMTDTALAGPLDMLWLWLDVGDDPRAPMAALKGIYGETVPIAVMTRIPSATEAVLALQQGARAYLNGQAQVAVLKRVRDTVLSGAVWLGADLVEFLSMALQVAAPTVPAAQAPAWRSQLTDRELQVAELIGRGMSNKLVARQLNITERTVKAHLTSIFGKLAISDRLRLALLVSGHESS